MRKAAKGLTGTAFFIFQQKHICMYWFMLSVSSCSFTSLFLSINRLAEAIDGPSTFKKDFVVLDRSYLEICINFQCEPSL